MVFLLCHVEARSLNHTDATTNTPITELPYLQRPFTFFTLTSRALDDSRNMVKINL